MKPSPVPRSVVIIGAGIAGLCAAVYARKCGYAVTVLEQHERPGGLATSWQRGGYTFEACLHWLLGSNPHDAMHALWREVFDIDRLHFVYPEEWIRVESEQGKHLSIYSNIDRLEAELLRDAPRDEAHIREFVHAVRSLSHCPLPSLSGAWRDRLMTGLQLLPRMPLLQSLSHITAEAYGKRFNDPLLRASSVKGRTRNSRCSRSSSRSRGSATRMPATRPVARRR